MENENRKGNGIFLGVVGVATLVVAIIGATFAYFSASANSDTEAINTASTSVALGFEDNTEGLKTNLIPAYDSYAEAAAKRTGEAGAGNSLGKNECIDDVDNEICSVYEFTIGNPSTSTAQTVYASLDVVTNEFKNLYYRIYDITDGGLVEVVTPTLLPATRESVTLNALSSTLSATSTAPANINKPTEYIPNEVSGSITNFKTYRMVLWIREIGTDQTSGDNDDDAKLFTAGITFTTGNGSGVTGVIGGATKQNYGQEPITE